MHPRDLQQAPTRLRRQLQQLSTRPADSTITATAAVGIAFVVNGHLAYYISNL